MCSTPVIGAYLFAEIKIHGCRNRLAIQLGYHYLNGIAEAVGEMRRMVLDRLRRGEFDGCEQLLTAMDDIYSFLVTIDYPDAMTGGLRRTTDQTRGILERTRGDLTMAIVQRAARG